MKSDIRNIFMAGERTFMIKYGKYPTHIKIGSRVMGEIREWEENNNSDFIQWLEASFGWAVEYDYDNRDTLELYFSDQPQPPF